jgi:hypothetical protein
VPRYVTFGAGLDCDFELPELVAAQHPVPVSWQVRTCQAHPPDEPSEPTGLDTVYGAVRVRAFSADDVARLVFDDTGTFDVRRSDRTITWYPGHDARDAAVRADLLGRVMSLAVHIDGGLALHASAVSIGGRAVAFLGDKHSGKSTLALALVRRGARLITDDTLVVQWIGPDAPLVAPGVQRVRLWPDSARALDLTASISTSDKPTIDALAPDSLEHGVVSLDACYVVRPAGGSPGADGVVRERMSPVHAALAGVRFAKLAALLGGREAPTVLDRATRLAGTTAFYVATVHRDLRRLDEVAARILEWHAVAAAPNVGDRP